MFKFVDQESVDDIEGFAYYNNQGEVEKVQIDGSDVVRITDGEDMCVIYTADIPKLILALQAAYDYETKETK
jgi:hypothetical protein